MREIKFRAWNDRDSDPKNRMREMVSITNQGLVIMPDGDTWDIPLMQYTGLKDKNGKEIYEGDLMMTDDMYHDYEDGVAINALPDGKIVQVEFRDGAFFARDEFLFEFATAWEIIGNIYENPELLEAKQ